MVCVRRNLELNPRAAGTRVKKRTSKREVPEAESGTSQERRIDDERLGPDQILRITTRLIRRIGDRLQTKDGEDELHTLATDLLKLLALQKELGAEDVQEVTVRWIGNDPEPPANG